MEDEKNAIEVLRRGGILIYPTDTAFGIGCRIDRQQSVRRLFQIRRRPESQAMPILVSNQAMALQYFDSPSVTVTELMKKYWPGALTIVSRCDTDKVNSIIRGGADSIGIRMPNHLKILNIISSLGVPIAGSSANFHGEKTPYSLQDLDQQLIKLADFILPGECSIRLASTVVDCTESPYTILRTGAIKLPPEGQVLQ